MNPNRSVTREYLDTLTTPFELGGALRIIREAADLSIRELGKKATDPNNGGVPRFVDLTKNLIEDMEKGRRLEGNRIGSGQDNRLEIYLWCCGVAKEDLPAWLETRRRVLREPAHVPPDPMPEGDPPSRPAVNALRRDIRTFIGREVELERIVTAADAGAPIYIIDGMPGVGKTALATRAAHLLADRYPDGRYFVELHAHTPGRAVADPADVLGGLLIGLGVDIRYLPSTLEGRRDLWRDRLTGKRVLLVLDDVRDAVQIEPLLPATPECLTLVTSRRRLLILDNAVPLALEIFDPGSAAELFTTLAGRTVENPENRAAVARIVQMCGYLPLAITLLAGRLGHHPSWTISALADEFGAARDRLGELDAGSRVVRAAFDLSYRELPSERQLLFRRLGLHPGPDLDAYAAAALAGIDVEAARWELESLYTDHLLDEPVHGRYRLHDLLREYAHALAGAEPGSDHARAQLLDYFQHVATAADCWLARSTRPGRESGAVPAGGVPAREFGDEIQALEWMRLERDNLLACLDHTMNRHRDRVAALTGVLGGLLDRDGPWPLACQLHQRAVDVAWDLGDRLGEAGALNNLGAVHRRAGDYDAAVGRLDAALVLYRRLGNRLGEANVLDNLGNVHEETGDYVESADLHQRALALYDTLGNRLGEANALNNLGIVHEETGDYVESADLHQRALALYHTLGNRLGEANALNNLGIVRTRTGLHAEAVDLHGQALEFYRKLGNRLGEANALNNLGIVRTRTGLHAEAVDLHGQALEFYRKLGNRLGEANALNNLGIVQTRTGLYAEAVDAHTQARALFHQLGNRRGEVEVLIDIGTLLLETGMPDAGMENFTEALGFAREVGSQLEQARALEGIARCRVSIGDISGIEQLREAVAVYRRIDAPEAIAAEAYLSELGLS
ncbi:ATP-binding protein [Nocardia alni]|uniref:ATP-binding protein n=1 Tax=Nocardia alni TaxID=2815723 RepID=UPI001C224FBE|nr:tetratricopeptide repeat protein [Nocardia alni]